MSGAGSDREGMQGRSGDSSQGVGIGIRSDFLPIPSPADEAGEECVSVSNAVRKKGAHGRVYCRLSRCCSDGIAPTRRFGSGEIDVQCGLVEALEIDAQRGVAGEQFLRFGAHVVAISLKRLYV